MATILHLILGMANANKTNKTTALVGSIALMSVEETNAVWRRIAQTSIDEEWAPTPASIALADTWYQLALESIPLDERSLISPIAILAEKE
jgi:hypothetical protein